MTTIEPLSSTGLAGSAARTGASAAEGALQTDFDNFLQLLTAQLRNQDPLDPQDPAEFVSQLTQFSQLEQQIAQGQKLDDLISAETAGVLAARSGLVGRTAAASVDEVVLTDGSSTFSYSVDTPADDVEVRIYDSRDRLMTAFEHEGGPGLGEIVWNGRRADGSMGADGAYRVEVVSSGSGASVGSALKIGQIAEFVLDGAGGAFVFADGSVVDPGAVKSIGL